MYEYQQDACSNFYTLEIYSDFWFCHFLLWSYNIIIIPIIINIISVIMNIRVIR